MRPYATPTIFKATLAQRLRELADRQRRPVEHVRQVLLMDRFLARVFATLGEAAVLRGSRAVDLRVGEDRTVRDLDLALDLQADRVEAALAEAGGLELGEWLRFEVAFDTNAALQLAEGFRVPLARYRVTPKLVGLSFGEPFAVDVSPPEPLVGEPTVLPGSDALAFAGIAPAPMRIIPLASHVADALHYYTLPQPLASHPRVWDLPELALLGTAGPLEAEELRAAIAATFAHRGTHPVPLGFPRPPASWHGLLQRMLRAERLIWVTAEDLAHAAGTFLGPVLAGGGGRWSPAVWHWER